MNPEKHGINMGLKNMSDLREFERERVLRVCLKEFYQRYYNVMSLVL